jgi:exonuclease VII small subunit
MIKFFRKKRYNLLEKDKIGNYLKYAVGEIVLVVIGIMIALSINNWNENRKLHDIKQTYYHQLEKDLESEVQNLNSQIIQLDRSIGSFNTYIEYTKKSDLQLVEIIQAISKIEVNWRYLSFHSNTIETLESTGDIKFILPTIRTKLIELRRMQESLITLANGNDNIYFVGLQKASNLGFSSTLGKANNLINQKIKNNYQDIILTMESSFGLKNFTEKIKKQRLKEMLGKVEELKALVEQELED